MNNLSRLQLKKSLQPILVNLWNANNNEKARNVFLEFVYIPKEFNGTNPPKVRFTLLMLNGRTQNSLNCDRVFVELFDDVVLHTYKRTLGLS